MHKVLAVVLIAIAIVGCDKKTGVETDGQAAEQAASFDAFIEYQDKRYDMAILGDCGTQPDGGFRTFAFTVGPDREPLPNGPQMLALSGSDWSIIDFYPASDDNIVRIYREGRDTFGFENGVLEFEGELGAGLTEQARATFICPQ